MNKFLPYVILSFLVLTVEVLFAGNPDRQGEAGAYELLINPWARGSAMNSLNASYVKGVEALRVNVSGLGRIKHSQALAGHTRWLVPSGVTVNSFGYATKVGKNGAIGIELMSLSFGDIKVTTTTAPEGTGATYSPNFFNLGVGYSHNFGEKVSVGILVRGVSESIQDLSAFGFAIDGGVQYVTGPENNFHLGIAIRNVGSPMRFGGEGLSTQLTSPENTALTYDVRLSNFELPSLLHLGLSYDFIFSNLLTVSPVANFTSNSFGRDVIGAGAELTIKDIFGVRASDVYEIGDAAGAGDGAYTGLGAGVSINIPMDKKGNNILAVDYGYRPTNPFSGTHNIGLGLNF
ncbi:MAG: PorV/PorQ family protein [Saprospiraceae bacterium]|nr:PorV/PorQ family protein [Candidatus Vicinibacter affinis]